MSENMKQEQFAGCVSLQDSHVTIAGIINISIVLKRRYQMSEIKNIETQDVKMWMPDQAQNFLDNCIGYNLQWMDTILDHMNLSKDNKNAVAEKVVSYLHILEAEMRRYYDL